MKRYGPSRRRAQNASAALRIFVRHPKKTFATISPWKRTSSGRSPCLRMGWTGRAPAPNRSENDRGHRNARSTSPCPIRQPLQSHTFFFFFFFFRITARLANVPRCLIGIGAGMATHYVARELSALGHDVKQVPPAYAKPFRQGHKNDDAVAEAVQRPSTRCVPVKTDDQLDLQALHRVRSRLVGQRTAVINHGARHCGTSGASLPPPTASGHPG